MSMPAHVAECGQLRTMPTPDASGQSPGLFLMTNSFEMGGSERQFISLAESLKTSPFSLQVGCLAKRGSLVPALKDVAEFPVGGNLYGPRSIRTRLRLARYLRQHQIAIAHAFDFYTNLILIPSARLAEVQVVIGSQRQLGDLLSPAKSRAQVAVLRWCDCVVCNSRAAADVLINQGLPKQKIAVIGNGLPPSAFMPTAPALPRSTSSLRVCMIARMNTLSKNHHLFLRVAAAVHRKFSSVGFLLVGDGPLRPQLERQARELDLLGCVQFLGECHNITAILASSDISVLPSASESSSNVILESMAAGVPVIASQVGGNPELIAGDRGILVPAGDDSALVAAIDRLLRDSSLRVDLGRNARRFAESNFTIEAVRKRYEELYAELLARRESRKPHHSSAYLNGRTKRLRLAIVAASLRYVGGHSAQANSMLANWQDDSAVKAQLIPIDPSFPRGLKWAESVPFLRTVLREPLYLFTLWRGIRSADIVHIFSASYWSFLLATAPACMMARALGKKTIVHYHSAEARDHLQRSWIARRFLAAADSLVVPSGYLADVFSESGLSAQVIPNTVDRAQFRFRQRKPLRAHLLCTRAFHPYYCVDLVVRAFAEVKRDFPDARLDLLGQGPLERDIRNLVRDLKLTGVNFAGTASRDSIHHFYNAADIFINASSLDNMPVSILEAFACGTPVVSTAPEGIRYLVEHERTGLLVQVGDAEGLAQNVIRLLKDPELCSQIVANAYEESTQYCWTQVRGQWLEIYNSILRETQNSADCRSRVA